MSYSASSSDVYSDDGGDDGDEVFSNESVTSGSSVRRPRRGARFDELPKRQQPARLARVDVRKETEKRRSGRLSGKEAEPPLADPERAPEDQRDSKRRNRGRRRDNDGDEDDDGDVVMHDDDDDEVLATPRYPTRRGTTAIEARPWRAFWPRSLTVSQALELGSDGEPRMPRHAASPADGTKRNASIVSRRRDRRTQVRIASDGVDKIIAVSRDGKPVEELQLRPEEYKAFVDPDAKRERRSVHRYTPRDMGAQSRADKRRRRNRFRLSDDERDGSSSDESHFQNIQRKKLEERREELMPVGAKGKADIDPMALDKTVGFDSVGGLDSHINALKEMVLLPLLYPEVFTKFAIKAPRGVLFHGPPGTGKTLTARALANSCSVAGRRVSFFYRKGADVLSKWVGEAERQLRLLFDTAYKMQPAIIFFDEIDGLAPVRSSKQDQIHSSIVSTLLALLDGLEDRGSIVVIGATNRPDAIDPALRRPGRFDRELFFPLPSVAARETIVRIHTRAWQPALPDALVARIAQRTPGFCGADLQALCSEAALAAVKLRYPQVYSSDARLQLDLAQLAVDEEHWDVALSVVAPASLRAVRSPVCAPLSAEMDLLLGGALAALRLLCAQLWPALFAPRHVAHGAGALLPGVTLTEGGSVLLKDTRAPVPLARPRLLVCARSAADGPHALVAALLAGAEHCRVLSIAVADLYGQASVHSPEEALGAAFAEAQRGGNAVLVLGDVALWWRAASTQLQLLLVALLASLPLAAPVLLVGVALDDKRSDDDDTPWLPQLFPDAHTHFTMPEVSASARRHLLLSGATGHGQSSGGVFRRAVQPLPVAPVAPPPVDPSLPKPPTEAEEEAAAIRKWKLILREINGRIMDMKRFKPFCAPVNPDEYPDYDTYVKEPMCLATIDDNISARKYFSIADFVRDFQQMRINARLYNPPENTEMLPNKAQEMIERVEGLVENFRKRHNLRQLEAVMARVGERVAQRLAAMPPPAVAENDDVCFECKLGGTLICCDRCPRAHHLDCVGLLHPPAAYEQWACCGPPADVGEAVDAAAAPPAAEPAVPEPQQWPPPVAVAEAPIVWEAVHADVALQLVVDRDIGAALELAVNESDEWGAEQLVAVHAALCAARHGVHNVDAAKQAVLTVLRRIK